MIGTATKFRSRSPWMPSAAFFLTLAISSVSLHAQPTQTVTDSVESETTRGPVTVKLSFAPKEPRLSDEPKLTLTVTADDGVEVKMPPFGESLGSFVIRDFYEPLPSTSNGRQVLQQIYTLEPTVAGSIPIDPITITFVDARSQGDGQPHEAQTEGLLIEVATMIDAEAPSLADLRPATDPVPLPSEVGTKAVAWSALAVITVLVAAYLIRKRLRPKTKSDPELTPQQLAWRELNDLLGTTLSETDLKEFFVQLTAVVRRYIERTTGINAPEQTTEEFLREVNARKLFAEAHNRRLEAFLESADLVKFAGYQPDADSIKESTHRAKQFISLEASDQNSGTPIATSTEVSL